MSKTLKKIKQKMYETIDIETNGEFAVELYMDTNVRELNRIVIERSSLPKLIKILQGEVEKC